MTYDKLDPLQAERIFIRKDPIKEDESSFYGHWVPYESDEELENAKNYLNLWMHFFCKMENLLVIDHKFIQRNWDELPEKFSFNKTIGIKFEAKKK
jgi:hypothetical protein